MAGRQRLICAGSSLINGEKGVRFTVDRAGRSMPAFVVRYRDGVYAYLNECGHVPAELDWQPGEFFDHSGLYLICSIHGALYAPESGRCLGGRCRGNKGLTPLPVREIDGNIYYLEPESPDG